MKFHNSDLGLSIEVHPTLLQELYKKGLEHYPKEFGGLLVGRYSSDRKMVVLVATILPTRFKSSQYSFERGMQGVREILQEYYEQSPRLLYVGEWHTHPDGPAIPSATDIRALQEITCHSEVHIENPVLLILSLGNHGFEPVFFVHFQNRIYPYQKE